MREILVEVAIDAEIDRCGRCPCFHHEHPMYCQAIKGDRHKKIVAPYAPPRPDWCPIKEQRRAANE